MKKRILILGGGISGERSISLKTANAVRNCIKKKYNCRIVEPDENLTKNIDRFSPHVVFNALHGRFGEDGFIQTFLESKGVRYTHSGVLSSMMAMDKEISKKLFIKNNILTPRFLKIKTDLDKKKVTKLLKKKIKYIEIPVHYKNKSVIDRTINFKNLYEVIVMFLRTFIEIKFFKRKTYRFTAKKYYL